MLTANETHAFVYVKENEHTHTCDMCTCTHTCTKTCAHHQLLHDSSPLLSPSWTLPNLLDFQLLMSLPKLISPSFQILVSNRKNLMVLTGLPRWLSVEECACQCRRFRFDPWVGTIPWRRKWHPTPVLLPGEPHAQ